MVGRGAIGQIGATLAATCLVTTPLWARPMTLAEAQEMGAKRSPEMGQAQARVGQAEALRDQARREWLPKFNVDAGVGWRRIDNDARVNLGLSSITSKPLYATIGVEQPIWDFGRRGNEVEAQKAGLAAAQQDEKSAGESVAFAIARAYLQTMAQERIQRAAQDNLVFHEALAADVSEGVARGAMSVSERQQAHERLQTAKVALEQARTDLIAARSELALLIGTDDFELALPEAASATLPATLDAALVDAATSDARLASARQRFDAASARADRARSERWPTIALRGSVTDGKDFQGYRGDTRDYELLFGLRWNLFDSGVTAAKIRQADHAKDEARFAYATAQRESELQLRKSWATLQNWRARSSEETARLAVSILVLESYRAQFGIGRRSLLDLLSAQNSVYDSTVNSEVARFGTMLAEYGMLAQLGRLRTHFGVAQGQIDPRLYGPQ